MSFPPLTKCCNWNEALGSSVIESQFSSFLPELLELRRDDGDSNKSGMCPSERFSTTDCGRIL